MRPHGKGDLGFHVLVPDSRLKIGELLPVHVDLATSGGAIFDIGNAVGQLENDGPIILLDLGVRFFVALFAIAASLRGHGVDQFRDFFPETLFDIRVRRRGIFETVMEVASANHDVGIDVKALENIYHSLKMIGVWHLVVVGLSRVLNLGVHLSAFWVWGSCFHIYRVTQKENPVKLFRLDGVTAAVVVGVCYGVCV